MGGVLTASAILGKNLLAKITSSAAPVLADVDDNEQPTADRMPSAA